MPTTTERGLGWSHQKRRAYLLKNLIDGTPCPCRPDCGPGCICVQSGGLPMFKKAALNPDGKPLEADHMVPRAYGGTQADRLLLSTCNSSRGGNLRWQDEQQFVTTLTSRIW